MTTNDFIYILFWACFAELIVLCIGVPIIIWTWHRTTPQRNAYANHQLVRQYIENSHILLDELYGDMKSGRVVAPSDTEERVLTVCSQASDVDHGKKREELW